MVLTSKKVIQLLFLLLPPFLVLFFVSRRVDMNPLNPWEDLTRPKPQAEASPFFHRHQLEHLYE